MVEVASKNPEVAHVEVIPDVEAHGTGEIGVMMPKAVLASMEPWCKMRGLVEEINTSRGVQEPEQEDMPNGSDIILTKTRHVAKIDREERNTRESDRGNKSLEQFRCSRLPTSPCVALASPSWSTCLLPDVVSVPLATPTAFVYPHVPASTCISHMVTLLAGPRVSVQLET